MLFSTTRIVGIAQGEEISVGTGFFYNSGKREYLITNKHVIEDCTELKFPIHAAPVGMPEYVYLQEHKIYQTKVSDWLLHPDPEIDLCCIPIDLFLSLSEPRPYFYIPISVSHIVKKGDLERMPATIGVAMIGYPRGLWDEKNGLPIIRQGTTASHPSVHFNDKDEVVIDMACFPGSSGSPVMFNEPSYFASTTKFLGVLYAGPTIDSEGEVLVEPIPSTYPKKVTVQSMMHLGYVITAKKVHEFVTDLENEN